ncbi:major facilitator superfamily domain-containing protein [Apiospora arundinis]|uniref:Major facilitator superfamily domain-containing protein n=1 Tax=Apiospora arundinis TaxID=335852 RepID=A0ABR2HKN5_9PEZI
MLVEPLHVPIYGATVDTHPLGVQILPITLIAVPAAAIEAVALSKQSKYKALHIIGFALLTAGVGFFSVLSRNSGTAEWVCLQILPSVGAGMVLDTLFPAFQAGVEERDSAAAATSWSFIEWEVKLRKVLKTDFGFESKEIDASLKE